MFILESVRNILWVVKFLKMRFCVVGSPRLSDPGKNCALLVFVIIYTAVSRLQKDKLKKKHEHFIQKKNKDNLLRLNKTTIFTAALILYSQNRFLLII